jgi:SAM-dependent methyltransferase
MGLKSFLNGLFLAANDHNRSNILSLAARESAATMLDLGCDEGTWTLEVAQKAKVQKITGVELNPTAAELARKKGIEVAIADLKDRLPFSEAAFDLIHSNQVIEHVPDVDQFASEAFRVLKPNGRLIVSTENGSSWHNIFAAILGWQIFSLTNLSSVQSGVGNPMALHRGSRDFASTWTHKVIFNYRGLVEFLALHGFTDIQVSGAGYYPFPTRWGSWDVRHAHFLTVSARKPRLSTR